MSSISTVFGPSSPCRASACRSSTRLRISARFQQSVRLSTRAMRASAASVRRLSVTSMPILITLPSGRRMFDHNTDRRSPLRASGCHSRNERLGCGPTVSMTRWRSCGSG